MLQRVAVRCSVLQCVTYIAHTDIKRVIADARKLACIMLQVCCSILQCVAVCYCVLQCVAACCSMLQCVAVCCSVLQCVTYIAHTDIKRVSGDARKSQLLNVPVNEGHVTLFEAQRLPVCCSVLQYIRILSSSHEQSLPLAYMYTHLRVAVCCTVSQRVAAAVSCSVYLCPFIITDKLSLSHEHDSPSRTNMTFPLSHTCMWINVEYIYIYIYIYHIYMYHINICKYIYIYTLTRIQHNTQCIHVQVHTQTHTDTKSPLYPYRGIVHAGCCSVMQCVAVCCSML